MNIEFIKTVPVIFVVNTVLVQYCVYYENYWNSLYLDFLVKKFLDPLAAFTQGRLARVWTF